MDEVIEKDAQYRAAPEEVEALKAARNKAEQVNGPLFGQLKKCDDEAKKAELQAQIDITTPPSRLMPTRWQSWRGRGRLLSASRRSCTPSPDDRPQRAHIGRTTPTTWKHSASVSRSCPDFSPSRTTPRSWRATASTWTLPGRVAGNGSFYYLLSNIAPPKRGSAGHARDFPMINKGFAYVIALHDARATCRWALCPSRRWNGRHDVQDRGRDLYHLIGTSGHTMIGRLIDQTIDEQDAPDPDLLYSPCFGRRRVPMASRERGIYRIHQFEKQEMIVVCRPEESADWYEKLWQMSVELFRSMEIPVRQLNCCSGDLADLRSRAAISRHGAPASKSISEVSCSNLGVQARRLHIRIKGKDGNQDLPGPHPEQHLRGTSAYADRLPGEPSAG